MAQTDFKHIENKERPANIIYFILKDYFNGTCLDVGCNVGRHLKLMPLKSVGVDIIAPPPDLKTDYRVLVYDLNNIPWPFKDESFDVVFCSHVIEHLRSPYDVLKEFHRILKRGGKLILGIPNPNCVYFDFYPLSKDRSWSDHIYSWTQKQAIRFITNCGFSVEKMYCNFPFLGKRWGEIWNALPITKTISPDMWFVCTKCDDRVYLKPSKRDLFEKLLIKLGLSGAMSQPHDK